MKKIIISILLVFNVILLNAQTLDYYPTFGTNKVYVNKVQGKYTVEFTCTNCNMDFETQVGPFAERLMDNLYITSDLSGLVDAHNVYPVYIQSDNEEIYLFSEILLTFKPTTTQAEKNNIINTYNLTLKRTSTSFENYFCSDPMQDSRDIFNSGLVEYCHPNFFTRMQYDAIIPTDPYFNKQFYLHNTGQVINDGNSGTADADIDAPEAWDITKGNSNTIVAVIDAGIGGNHNDLPGSRIVFVPGCNVVAAYDPVQNDPNNPAPTSNVANNFHGQAVAGIVAATHDNEGVAGIAPNCKILPIRLGTGTIQNADLAVAMDLCVQNGAHIITNSYSFGIGTSIPVWEVAIKNAIAAGVSVLFSASNSANNHNNDPGQISYPSNPGLSGFSAFKGMHVVGATDRNDELAYYSPQNQPWHNNINICAPSHKAYFFQESSENLSVWTIDNPGADGLNSFPVFNTNHGITAGTFLPSAGSNFSHYAGRFGGTSAATPMVAGVLALMLDVNPCLDPHSLKDIINNSADKVGGYDYNYLNAQGHSQEVGYGRLNAFEAVKMAQYAHSTTLDLYIKDCDKDMGGVGSNYACWTTTDKSPDIWVRNMQVADVDNLEYYETVHQDAEYSATAPVYMYVNVRNKSCQASLGTEKLSVYWSVAATWQSWPQNWDGTDPTIGDVIANITLPVLQPGEIKTIEIPWTMPSALDPGGLSSSKPFCVLARIENSILDPIIANAGVESSNNIAINNMMVVDNINNIAFEAPDGRFFPIGEEILIGNPTEIARDFDLNFELQSGDLFTNGEIHLLTNEVGYGILSESSSFDQAGVKGIPENYEIIISASNIKLEDLSFGALERVPLFVGIVFFTDGASNQDEYKYLISQSDPDATNNLGGENIIFKKYPRNYFSANAGPDKVIKAGQSISLNAMSVPESVIYKWTNNSNGETFDGMNIQIAPNQTTDFTLQVISTSDGFMDTDDVEVKVLNGSIDLLVPNPVTNNLNVSYSLNNVTNAQLLLQPSSGSGPTYFTLDIESETCQIDMTNYPIGNYTLILICDGLSTDAENLLKL